MTRKEIEKAGVRLRETKEPLPLLDGDVLYLGEIYRQTEFEKGMPNAFFMDKGIETWDPIEEDTGIAINIKGRGLVVLTGCAHSGIVNTVNYARTVTGVNPVHVIMGGFHLAGPAFRAYRGKDNRGAEKNKSRLYRAHALHGKEIGDGNREGHAGAIYLEHGGNRADLFFLMHPHAADARGLLVHLRSIPIRTFVPPEIVIADRIVISIIPLLFNERGMIRFICFMNQPVRSHDRPNETSMLLDRLDSI